VAIKTINGKQCAIFWHVDDLKISHVDKNVIEDIIKLLNKYCLLKTERDPAAGAQSI